MDRTSAYGSLSQTFTNIQFLARDAYITSRAKKDAKQHNEGLKQLVVRAL